MWFDPVVRNESALVETQRRFAAEISRGELAPDAALAIVFGLATLGLWLLVPVHSVRWGLAGLTVLIAVVAMRVRFQTPFGFTVATQLAFVPALFAVPAPLVPLVMLLAFTVSRLPEMLGGRLSWRKLLQGPSNSCFALGPAWVFALGAPATRAGPAELVLALVAQLLADLLGSAVFCHITRGATLREQLRETQWVWAIDIALTPVALVVAEASLRRPVVVLAVIPLLGLLLMFARERSGRVEGLLALGASYRGTALLLGDVIDGDDDYTGMHSRGVVELALAVGAALGLDDAQLRNLEFAALLHDVGKIAIPKEIINKPGSLTDDERAIIQTHPEVGQRMLARVGGLLGEVGGIVRSHHERWDGGGYPDGLLGDAAPLEARIITCCDSWSAMRTDRPYRAALSHEAAVAEIKRCSAAQFDPRIARALLSVVGVAQDGDSGDDQAPADANALLPAAA